MLRRKLDQSNYFRAEISQKEEKLLTFKEEKRIDF